MITRVASVGVRAGDQDRAVEFYVGRLGFETLLHVSNFFTNDAATTRPVTASGPAGYSAPIRTPARQYRTLSGVNATSKPTPPTRRARAASSRSSG